ncbi:MAG: transporter substrate-binding domain-containing protein [Deltaproteobacteria bacterium]|nr:transporter substrate-binding domain-containing protein [Deltaproteobacteria bacterium]
MFKIILTAIITVVMGWFATPETHADLRHIEESGVLRHLGIPYSNFVTGDGDGLDVEILKMYSSEIGVQYVHVLTSWETVIGDLSGKKIIPKGDEVEIVGETPVKGDIIGNGLTVLPWRKKVIHFSDPYFPTAIWVLARADSGLNPIKPSGDHEKDVVLTKNLLIGRQILGIRETCLDPDLYNLQGCASRYKEGLQLNDLPAAIVKGDCELTLQDAPDALLALANYPGKVKVIGAITEEQFMAFGISKDSPELLESFNNFLRKLRDNGKLKELIIKYYPLTTNYFPNAGK